MREGKHVIVSICYSVVIFNAVAFDLLFTCKLSVFGTETWNARCLCRTYALLAKRSIDCSLSLSLSVRVGGVGGGGGMGGG